MNNLIELSNISKTFEKKNKLRVLKKISFRFKEEKYIHLWGLLDLVNQHY